MSRADTVAKLALAVLILAAAGIIFHKRTHPPPPEWADDPVSWICLPCGGTFEVAGWADLCPDCSNGAPRTDVPEDWICTGYSRLAAEGSCDCPGAPVSLHGQTGPPPSVIYLRGEAPPEGQNP